MTSKQEYQKSINIPIIYRRKTLVKAEGISQSTHSASSGIHHQKGHLGLDSQIPSLLAVTLGDEDQA